MSQTKTTDEYTKTLDETRELIDRARLRAAEIKIQAACEGFEEPLQRDKMIKSNMRVEIAHIQGTLNDLHRKLGNIKSQLD